MGKTQIRSEDIFKRISFLYQAAKSCLETTKNIPLSRYYIDCLQAIARKNRISLHPDIKRSICKRCSSLLVPGVTSKVKVKKKGQKMTTITCLECGTTRAYVYNPKYTPMIDLEETWDNVFINGQTVDRKIESKPGKKQQQKKGAGAQGSCDPQQSTSLDT